MKNNILSGQEVLARLVAADNANRVKGGSGILTEDQRKAAQAGTLSAVFEEKYHRAYIANTGTGDTQIPIYDITFEKESGVTNLEKGVKLADDFVMVATRSRISTIATPNTNAITAARNTDKLKVAEFSNLMQAAGANQTLSIPSEITGSEFQLNIDSNKQFSFGFKNYFQYNNRKDAIEANAADSIAVPNGLVLVKKGKALKPTIVLPNNVTVPNTTPGGSSVSYAAEFTAIGYTLVIEA